MEPDTRHIDTNLSDAACLPLARSGSANAGAFVPTGSHDGLSSFWRKNTSTCEATELANLLRSLRKVAGYLGENVGRIEFLGMSHMDAASIVLDPTLVTGRYPVPARKTDYLVGMVVHEALHQTQWSERVWRLLADDFSGMNPIDRVMFQKIVNAGEDIYVDRLSESSLLGQYVAQTRGRALEKARTKLRSEILTFDALVYFWWISTWSKRITEIIEPVYLSCLVVLGQLTNKLEELPCREKSISRRTETRAEYYRKTWEELLPLAGHLPVVDKRLIWFGDVAAIDCQTTKKSETCSRQGVSRELAGQIETRLAEHSADITPIIRAVAGDDNPDVAPMSRWDFNIASHPVIDRRMVGRLKAIFTNYAVRRKVVSRGLSGGKVDGRRLYRAPVNGKCFCATDRIPTMDWNVTLLLDATGSMRGTKWRMVENTVGNLHRALLGCGNRLWAFAYFEMDGICMISKLISGRNLLSVPPSGQTASGQAIIAAAHFMPRDNKRKLLIHVTDGESNFGVDVGLAIEHCRNKKIDLVTLGCGEKDRDAMRGQYGNTIQFISQMGQLSQAVEKLLKWNFIYRNRNKPSDQSGLDRLFGKPHT